MGSPPQSFNPLQDKLDWNEVFKRALARGGEWADVFWERSSNTQISVEAKSLRELSSGLDEGLGLRVLCEGKCVYGFTNDLSAEGIFELADRLASGVRSPNSNPPKWNSSARQIATHDLGFQIVTPPSLGALDKKIRLLQQAEAICTSHGPSIKNVNTVLGDSRRQIFVARSDGKSCFDDKSYITLRCVVTGLSPTHQLQRAYNTAGGFWGMEHLDEKVVSSLATETLRQLEVLYKAVPAPRGTIPVVMAARAGGTLWHEAVGHGLEADLAMEGLSVYKDQIGKQVASKLVTVIDDGTMPFKRGSHAFDDEGTPTQRTVLIDEGVLKSYMADKKSALKFGMSSTGNGRRQTYRHAPMVRMTNTYVASGSEDPAKILKDTSWGLFVASVGGGQVDTVSGNFVFHVREAYLIRNGELAEPVASAMLSGNGPQILKQIDRVGNDLGWSNGTCGKNSQSAPVTDAQPTLRMPQITVGGQVDLTKYFQAPT